MAGGGSSSSGLEPAHQEAPYEGRPVWTGARHNVPVALTSFVGRDGELAEAKRLLATTRLLTLTGAGGVGKTRLALQVVSDLVEDYPDGVWLVDLAPLADPALVPPAVAAAVRVREEPGRALIATLTSFLASRSLLLVLDNCEHLALACAWLAECLLQACPHVQVLATSRHALGLVGETTWRVPSLTLPEVPQAPAAAATTTVDLISRLMRSEAARLFVERVQAVVTTFAVTDQNAIAVADVCRRLDGIPLALELAAARVKALSVEQISARLDDRLRLLTGGSPTALARHRTLRGAIDWSYDLLSEPERVLLRRLAVFAGGCTLEAAEAVCADRVDTGGRVTSSFCLLLLEDVLDVLTQLVEKSLVLAEEQRGAVRYRLLETIRQYGEEKLRAAAEEASTRGRHAAYYLSLAEQAAPELLGPDQVFWLVCLEADHDNLRAALAFSRAAGDAELELRLAGALAQFWIGHGHFGEGRRWLESALAASGQVSPSWRVKALAGAGDLAFGQGDFGLSGQLFEESLALARELGDTLGSAVALGGVGMVATYMGSHERALPLLDEALTLFRALGNRWWISWTLRIFARAMLGRGDSERAAVLLEEGLAVARGFGDPRGIGWSLHILGLIRETQGRNKQAAVLHEESLSVFRGMEHAWGIAAELFRLGAIAHARGDYAQALAQYAECLRMTRDMGDRYGIADPLQGLGAIRASSGTTEHLEQGARLIGAADALRGAFGGPPLPADQAEYERRRVSVRAKLGKHAFAVASAVGREIGLSAVSLDHLIAETLGWVDAIRAQPGPAEVHSGGNPMSLTPREQQVAALLARGCTNSQIAAELVTGARTAEWHVANILSKLGLTSRAQAAVWAVTHLAADGAAPPGSNR